MKVIQLYNIQRSGGGGESRVVNSTQELLTRYGHAAKVFTRDSQTVTTFTHRVKAAFKGVYSWEARRAVGDILRREHPDVVHVHNLYPLFSPSVLTACKEYGTAVVMTVHNYGLMCPVQNHLCHGVVCERCTHGREYLCLLHDCKNDLCESAAYALRNIIARKKRWFHDGVSRFIAVSEYVRDRLCSAGIPDEQVVTIHNSVPIPDRPANPMYGKYVGFVGRVSAEKGIECLLDSAARLPTIEVSIAGDGPEMPALLGMAPNNVSFVGWLQGQQISSWYQNARFIVVPSVWWEPCSLVVLEAMSYGLPVIASKLGGLPELVEHGLNGFLVEPGNVDELARRIAHLWDSPDLCQIMGRASRKKAIQRHSEELYYEKLVATYEAAIESSHGDKMRARGEEL